MVDAKFIRQVGTWRWLWRTANLQLHKRVLRQDLHATLPTGLRIRLPRESQSASEVFVTGANIDWGAEALLARLADPDRDFLDIGAHIGYYSMYLSPLVRRAFAFEPDPRNLKHLRENARSANNVEVIAAAVSSKDAVVKLHIGAGSAISSLNPMPGATVDVPALRIDSFCARRPSIDPAIVKTDVEGHDLEVLRGMAGLIRRSAPVILTECSSHDEMTDLCDDWRYTMFAFVCDPASMAVSFRRLGPGDHRHHWLKMTLLSPPHLTQELTRDVAA